MHAIFETTKLAWPRLLVYVFITLAGVSVFFEPIESLNRSAAPWAQLVWPIAFTATGILLLINAYKPNPLLMYMGLVGLATGLSIYIVAVVSNPRASYFLPLMIIAALFLSYDKFRKEKQLEELQKNFLELKRVLEKDFPR